MSRKLDDMDAVLEGIGDAIGPWVVVIFVAVIGGLIIFGGFKPWQTIEKEIPSMSVTQARGLVKTYDKTDNQHIKQQIIDVFCRSQLNATTVPTDIAAAQKQLCR